VIERRGYSAIAVVSLVLLCPGGLLAQEGGPLQIRLAAYVLGGTQTRPSGWTGDKLQGEPVRFSVSLSCPQDRGADGSANGGQEPPARNRVRLAAPGGDWTEYLTVRFYRKGHAGWTEILRNFPWREATPPADAAELPAEEVSEHPAEVRFILPPQLTRSLKPGTYLVTAIYDSRRAPAGVWRGRLEAKAWDFSVHAVKGKAAEADLLCSLSGYAQEYEDVGQAEQLALRATVLDPKDAETWFRLAEAATANRNWEQAIAAYERLKKFAFARDALVQRSLDDSIRGVERLRSEDTPTGQ
jgi:hypothetical protein